LPPSRFGSEAAEAWDRTKETTSVVALEAFIRRFGDTYYGDLARARIAELKEAEAAKKAAEASRQGAVHAMKSSIEGLVSGCSKGFHSWRGKEDHWLEDKKWTITTISFDDNGQVNLTEDQQKREMWNHSFRPKKLLTFVREDVRKVRAKLSELDSVVRAKSNVVFIRCAKSACLDETARVKKDGHIFQDKRSETRFAFCDASTAQRIANALSELIQFSSTR
jgi:hypothetical protein